jgi:translation initiation factor 4E
MATTNNNNNAENEHLLESKWVLWYRPPASNTAAQAKDWEISQQLKFTTGTVENFWRGFHELPRIRPGHAVNCDYSLFKEGVKPMWEDEFNKHGGRWTYTVERRQPNLNNMSSTNIIAQVWLDVMLCLIGEGFDPYGHLIGGGVCGIRGGRGQSKGPDNMIAKVHIWTKDASNAEANIKIGEILKEVLHAPDGSLSYCSHDTAAAGRKNYSYKL